jgi:hypothetical protein
VVLQSRQITKSQSPVCRDPEATGLPERNEKLPEKLLKPEKSGFLDVDVLYRDHTVIVTVERKT